MADIMSFLRNYNYEVCLSTGKIWTLIEAADYLAGHLAGKQSWTGREEAFNGFMEIKDRLLAAMKQDIDADKLAVSEVYLDGAGTAENGHYELDPGKTTIRPFVFISWAIAGDIEVPEEFQKYLRRKKKGGKSGYYEGLGLKRSTVHHERSRAVAELLWSWEPDMPIAEMARRPEITKYGCEGQEYDMRTVCRWLATLKVDRHPGQPRKKKVQLEPVLSAVD
jgi:hypothetical protein